MSGTTRYYLQLAGLWAAICLVGFIIIEVFPAPTDDTDRNRRERSGMTLFTDHGTGCQYLGHFMFGPRVPRMSADGERHMGCREVQR